MDPVQGRIRKLVTALCAREDKNDSGLSQLHIDSLHSEFPI